MSLLNSGQPKNMINKLSIKTLLKGSIFILVIGLFYQMQVRPIMNNWSLYSERFNPSSYEKQYNASQYMIPQSKNSISDETLLSYAGYKYATGTSPILINSDHPPLGKYIIGWITLAFGNNRISSLIFSSLSVVLIASITYLLTKSSTLSALAIGMLSVDSVLMDQIRYAPILDIIQVSFLLLYILFIHLFLQKEKTIFLILAGVAVGCMSATKLYFPALLLIATTGLTFLLTKQFTFKKIILFTGSLFVLAGGVYTLSYLQYFLDGGTLRGFLGVQKWIFLFWKDNSVVKSGYDYKWGAFSLILFNKWKIWWGTTPTIPASNWTFFWPLFFIFGTLSAIGTIILWIKNAITKKSVMILFLSLWIVVSTMYLNMLPLSTRYLMIVYFPIYILIPVTIQKLSVFLANFYKIKNE